MPCAITGLVVNGAGVPQPGVRVWAEPADVTTIYLAVGEIYAELVEPWPAIYSASDGSFSLELWRPSEVTPASLAWDLHTGDYATYRGTVPDLDTVDMTELLAHRGWRLVE
jgi:hypothetical protein